jgi:hypothetical protein
MEELLAFLFYAVFELLLIGAGRVVVRLASFGKWRGEKFGGDEAKVNAPAGSLTFVLGQQRVFTRTGLAIVGILAVLAALGLAAVTFSA